MSDAGQVLRDRLEPGLEDDVDHYFCCDVDTAICGEDIAGQEVEPPIPGDQDCELCLVLIPTRCPRCARAGWSGRYAR